MKIATINQRCVYKKDGNQSFIHRAVFLCDKIESEKPDVIGFQEVVASSLKALVKDKNSAHFFAEAILSSKRERRERPCRMRKYPIKSGITSKVINSGLIKNKNPINIRPIPIKIPFSIGDPNQCANHGNSGVPNQKYHEQIIKRDGKRVQRAVPA